MSVSGLTLSLLSRAWGYTFWTERHLQEAVSQQRNSHDRGTPRGYIGVGGGAPGRSRCGLPTTGRRRSLSRSLAKVAHQGIIIARGRTSSQGGAEARIAASGLQGAVRFLMISLSTVLRLFYSKIFCAMNTRRIFYLGICEMDRISYFRIFCAMNRNFYSRIICEINGRSFSLQSYIW